MEGIPNPSNTVYIYPVQEVLNYFNQCRVTPIDLTQFIVVCGENIASNEAKDLTETACFPCIPSIEQFNCSKQ